MRRAKSVVFVVIVAVLMSAAWTGLATAKGYNALFIFWRGQTECADGIMEGLTAAGMDVAVQPFNADKSKEALSDFLNNLNEDTYDFIYTFGTTASVMTAAKVKKTPIFFGIVAAPVKAGLIKEWKNPGGNVTGVSHLAPVSDQVEFIAELGEFKSIGLLYNPQEENSVIIKKELEQKLQSKGMSLHAVEVSDTKAIAPAVDKLASGKVDLIYLPSDSFIISKADAVLGAINGKSIPTYGAVESLVQAGAAVGITASYKTVGKRLAEKIVQVLKHGTPAGKVPAEVLPMDLQTIEINKNTVEALKLAIPEEIKSKALFVE